MQNISIEFFNPSNSADTQAVALVMREAFNSVNQDWNEVTSMTYVNHFQGSSCNLVARVDGKIVGFLFADQKPEMLYIDAIAVRPTEMGKGIAKKLWEKALLYCQDNLLTEIKMIADPKSQAYQWYRKLGFEETKWVEMVRKVEKE